MSCIVSYATRPHPDETRSTLAIAIGDVTYLQKARARGVTLELQALLRALGLALKAPAPIDHVAVTPQLHAVLTGAEQPPVTARALVEKIRAFLAAHPRQLVVGEQPPALVARLEEAGPSRALTGLPDNDVVWACEHGATVVYTDGAAHSETYLAGWSWYVDETRYRVGPVPHLATSFTAERHAVARALSDVDGPVLLVTDAWDLTVARDVYVAAQGVVDELDDLIAARGDQLRLCYVKGHGDILGNVAADQLAGHAREQVVCDVTTDPVRHRRHRRDVAALLEATAEHRAAQKVKQAWFKDRAYEIIGAAYPGWSQLPVEDRRVLGREITLRMRAEYASLHPNVGDDAEAVIDVLDTVV